MSAVTSEIASSNPEPIACLTNHEDMLHQSVNSTQATQKGPEKTISCVSCRKRKLKCDRVKPKCGTCVRLRHECVYPERRRNLGVKRGRSSKEKEIEARLETRFISDTKSDMTSPNSASPNITRKWNLSSDVNMEMGTGPLHGPSETTAPGRGFSHMAVPAEPLLNRNGQLLSCGLQEPLPPQEAINELYQIYFNLYHPTMPIIHRSRFYLSLDRAPHTRPPICLSYAMWTLATTLSPKYRDCEEIFYERTRRYLEIAEMKGHGESFVSLYHAQTWGLVCNYEARKMYFSRSWMSTGRMVRLVQMLGLWRLDHDEADAKDYLPPPKDWVELEERRRTFWAAFYSDRFASSGSGWPMIIQEHEELPTIPDFVTHANLNQVFTNLPSSEQAFESGIPEKTTSLKDALLPEGATRLSVYGGVLLTAAFFGHFFQHVRGTGPSHHPEDIQNGEFWKRHRRMENSLNNTFIFLPEALRLPTGIRDMNVIFLHMNIQASIIGLHRTAVMTATRYNVDPMVARQSRARTFIAAEEIVSILHQIHTEDAFRMVPWVGFCLYVAAGIFLDDLKSDSPNHNSYSNLDQILNAMRLFSVHHSITKGFLAQCELDVASIGKNRFGRDVNIDSNVLAESQGVPITIADMQALLLQPPEKIGKSPPVDKNFLALGSTAYKLGRSPQLMSSQLPKSSSPTTTPSLMNETSETPSWESHVDPQNPCYGNLVYHPRNTSSEQGIGCAGFPDYTHTSSTNNYQTKSNSIVPHPLQYEHISPLSYEKTVDCIPVYDNIVVDDFNLSSDWTIPVPFDTTDPNSYETSSSTAWSHSKHPAVDTARGGGAG